MLQNTESSFTDEIYRRRISAVRGELSSVGVDLAVFYSNGKHTFLEMEPFHYFSGFKPMGPHSALFLPKDDEPILLTTPSLEMDRMQRRSWIAHSVATDNFSEEFRSIIGRKNWKKASIGITGLARQSKGIIALINSQFERSAQAVEETVRNVGRIRDELEITLATRATEIADRGYQYMLQIAKPGMIEYQLAAEVHCYVKSLGAEDNFQILSASQHNLGGQLPTDRRLDIGDVIEAEISPSCGGQFIQICRTAVLGPVSEMQHDKYQVLIDGMVAGMKAGVPKAKAKDVTKALNESIERAGYGKYGSPPYMRVRGHGLGFGSTLPGDLSMENETLLEEGMMFILHPNQYIPETGHLLCGETVVVTKLGLKPLTSRLLALDSIPV